MAKFKAPGKGKKTAAQRPNAIGCIVLLTILFALLFLIVYITVQQG